MAEPPQNSPRGTTPSSIPQKRTLEDDHTPTISSPLNPDAPSRASRAPAREQREKKESLKKREAAGIGKKSTMEEMSRKSKNSKDRPVALSPIRYHHPLPKETFHYLNKDPTFVSRETGPLFAPGGSELKKPNDHTENKKAYRYTPCTAVPSFKHSHYYRNTDAKPYGPRMSLSDSDKNFHFDEATGCIITNEKGWRVGRANVVAREGTFYYEVKILKGVPQESNTPASNVNPSDRGGSGAGPVPHVRVGWARREAPLDTPVGFDGYSYGLTDTRLEPMHKSRACKFFDKGDDNPVNSAATKKTSKNSKSAIAKARQAAAAATFFAEDSAREGDVIGLSITLPSLTLHRKVAVGTYNPLADVGAGENTTGYDDFEQAPNIVRDRFPVPYKGGMYFESIQYAASRGMDSYGDRGPFAKETPSPNHDDPTLRLLPKSNIKVWKNGKRIGTAFKDLMAFLPPCSQPANEKGVRSGLDDGMVGYYPAVGVFSGAVAQVNFGPNWWCPPEGLAGAGPSNSDVTKKEESTQDSPVKHEDGIEKSPGGEATKDGEDGEDAIMADAAATKNGSDANAEGSGSGAATQTIRGIGERFQEQIAEDVVYDIIDEVDFFVQDGGKVDE